LSTLTAEDVFGTAEAVFNPEHLAEQFDPTPHDLVDEPVEWITGSEFVWSKQREIAESVAEHRHTAVQACHGPGKSFLAARLACWWIDTRPVGEAFVVTTAPTWSQVKSILWREIRSARRKRDLDGRTTLACEWYRGGKRIGDEEEQLVALGRKPADYDQAAFQGIHARYVLVIIDEGSGVPKLLYDAVDSLATNIHSRVLAIGNPDDPASEFAKVCGPGSGWKVHKISVLDTPAFTGEEVPDGLLDLLPSKEWVAERKSRWGESSPIYQSKVLGEFPEIGEDTLISPALIRKAEEQELPGLEKGQYGWDIARYGSNKTVGYRYRGGVVRQVYEASKQSTMKTAGAIHAEVEPHKGGVPAWVDADGIGGGVVDRLWEQRVKGIQAFHGGVAANEPDRFVNRRSEVWWNFRELMEDGRIDLAPAGEDDDLKAQLGAIKWGLDSKGRIAVETKKEMAKRGLPSPDHADGAVMSAVRSVQMPQRENGRGRTEESLTGDLMTREM
jgi:hypothetical protein